MDDIKFVVNIDFLKLMPSELLILLAVVLSIIIITMLLAGKELKNDK